MRKQLVESVNYVLGNNKSCILLLGDIGVFGFRNAFELFPDRVYNIGILEQSTIGLAAGLAMTGYIPIVHTIAPFLVERSYEQLKLDFGFQKLGGNFISVGASYDYAALGATHHCPADVGILKNIPGMEIVTPGTKEEFNSLFLESYNNGNPTYFRLSERCNDESSSVSFGQANVIKKGKMATVIAVGPMLKAVLAAVENLDVTLLYYTTLSPFDQKTLRNNCPTNKIIVCEPYYSGALAQEIQEALSPQPIALTFIGIPRVFLTNYGTAEEHDEFFGLTPSGINNIITKAIYGK